jgi:hypothetical protein
MTTLSNETEARLRAEVERNTAPFRTPDIAGMKRLHGDGVIDDTEALQQRLSAAPDIAGLCKKLRAFSGGSYREEAADILERQAAEIERLQDSAAKTFVDVMFLRKDHPGQSEQFYAEEASSLCRRALAALTGED